MQILSIAGYKFIPLDQLQTLRQTLLQCCDRLGVKGTILLSTEGININLAGLISNVLAFKAELLEDCRFAAISFHETYSNELPYQRLKVKVKREIITLKQPEVDAVKTRAPALSPEELKQWLDEKRDLTLLDTRNDYEVRFGTFTGAHNLHMADFSHFPLSLAGVDREKPIVMFCTGGIRCEKAALYMQQQGYDNVYQLDGGILGYFARVGGAHYQGECFVFDERVSLDAALHDTGTVQCRGCQGPVTLAEQQQPEYKAGMACPACKAA